MMLVGEKKDAHKIVSADTVATALSEYSGKKIVLVGGCFDIFHYGHHAFLREARTRGDVLVVLLESDEFMEKRKNRKSVHTQEQRAEILSSLSYVDLVVSLPYFESYDEYYELVKTIKPTIIAITEGDKFLKEKKMQAESIGATVEEVSPLITNHSTSRIIEYASVFRD